MNGPGFVGEGVADIVEVVLHMPAHLPHGLHHHLAHFGRRLGLGLGLGPPDGGGHDRLAHRLGAAGRAGEQAAALLVVEVGAGGEPALEVVLVLADQGELDHGWAKARSLARAGMAARALATASRSSSAVTIPGSS